MSRFVVEHQAAVDELALSHLHRRVDHRQGPGGAHGRGDRNVAQALLAEDDPLARVEVGRGQVQLTRELAKVVAAPRLVEHPVQVALDPRAGVRAGGQAFGKTQHHVHQRDLPPLSDEIAGQRQRAQWQQRPLTGQLEQVQAQ